MASRCRGVFGGDLLTSLFSLVTSGAADALKQEFLFCSRESSHTSSGFRRLEYGVDFLRSERCSRIRFRRRSGCAASSPLRGARTLIHRRQLSIDSNDDSIVYILFLIFLQYRRIPSSRSRCAWCINCVSFTLSTRFRLPSEKNRTYRQHLSTSGASREQQLAFLCTW
jgi:hypothetical protein